MPHGDSQSWCLIIWRESMATTKAWKKALFYWLKVSHLTGIQGRNDFHSLEQDRYGLLQSLFFYLNLSSYLDTGNVICTCIYLKNHILSCSNYLKGEVNPDNKLVSRKAENERNKCSVNRKSRAYHWLDSWLIWGSSRWAPHIRDLTKRKRLPPCGGWKRTPGSVWKTNRESKIIVIDVLGFIKHVSWGYTVLNLI